MLMNEASRITKLTKKAIEYYTLQGLVVPAVSENGYRDYSEADIEILNKIGILRKLDLGTDEIRAILGDETGESLQAAAIRKELDFQRGIKKKELLNELSSGKSYEEVRGKLEALEQSKTITEKLLEAFPGYYGRFVCMHFARFLNEPVRTEEQKSAYDTVISFLDNVPPMDIPKELEEYLIEGTKNLGTEQMKKILEASKKSVENPEEFLKDSKEMLEQYLACRQSDEYKDSPAGKLMELMKKINGANGYNTVFIPAMKRLSSSYAEYYRSLEVANEKLLAQYPEIEKLGAQN